MTFNDVEATRQTYHFKLRKCRMVTTGIILAFLAIIFFSVLFTRDSDLFPFLLVASCPTSIIAILIIFIIPLILTSKQSADYYRAYKAYFVEQNLRAVFSDLYYAHDKGLPREILDSTNMINTGDRFSSNDFTSGKYKNVSFAQADASIEVEHTDSDGNSTYITIFKGRFMIFEFLKQFNFKLELVGNRFPAERIPGKNPTTGRKMQKISTESAEFNKTFKIYGEDGFEAYYILDPAFMVKIQNIADRYKNRLLLGFTDNRLLIGLNDGKDSFEPPKPSKPIDEATEHQKIATDIKIITDFVDQLSLDRKLFK